MSCKTYFFLNFSLIFLGANEIPGNGVLVTLALLTRFGVSLGPFIYYVMPVGVFLIQYQSYKGRSLQLIFG